MENNTFKGSLRLNRADMPKEDSYQSQEQHLHLTSK